MIDKERALEFLIADNNALRKSCEGFKARLEKALRDKTEAYDRMTADRDAWKAKAERYREVLENMSRDESLRWAGFIVRDVARAALIEDAEK